MLLIAWDLDGTIVHTDRVPRLTGPLAQKCVASITCEDGTYYTYLRPHAASVLRWFMERKEDYACVLYSAASYEYVHEIVDKVVYPAIDALGALPLRFERVYTREDMVEGEKNVIVACSNDIFFDDAILIDDLWPNCVSCGCASVLVPRYDPYVEENKESATDCILLQVMLGIRDNAFLRFKQNSGDRKYTLEPR